MIAASSSFAAAIGQSHEPAIRVVLLNSFGEELEELPIEDGSVTLDGAAVTRASLSLSLAPDAADLVRLVADDYDDPLAPCGNEIAVYRGITYIDGSVEYLQLGVFPIDEFSAQDNDGGADVSVSALDRSSVLIDAVFEESGVIEEGTNAYTAIISLVQAVYPDCTFTFTAADTDVTLPALSYEVNDDRWDFVQACAEAAQSLLFFNNQGELTVAPAPNTVTPIHTLDEGDVLLAASKQWGKANAVNRVYVEGNSSAADPVTPGDARDTSPLSPTRYGGPFGRHTMTYSSEFITTDEQAQDVAETILAQKVGSTQEIGFASLADPRLEPLDVVRITRTPLKIDEIHVIDSLTIPLTYDGDLTGQTRAVRVV